MLDLASLGTTHPHHFVFGGVAFEIEFAGLQLSAELERLTVRGDPSLPVVAVVRCSISIDPSLPNRAIRGLVIERAGDTTRIASQEMWAQLSRVSPVRYEAFAGIAPAQGSDGLPLMRGPDAVVAGIAGAIIEEQGGLQLHAAAIELDGSGVLFLGPSGAGKSTAVGLVEGARVFAFDRVTVARDSKGAYAVWALPGGARVDVPPSALRVLPLAAVLRVRKGQAQPHVCKLDGARALFAIRESTEVGDRSVAGEEQRMNAAVALAARVLVGEISTVLEAPHRALLHEFLSAERAMYAPARKERPDVEC